MADKAATPYQIVRAAVTLDGRAVPVEIGIPGAVLDALAGDVREGKPCWRIGMLKNVAVRVDVERKREPQDEAPPNKKRKRRRGVGWRDELRGEFKTREEAQASAELSPTARTAPATAIAGRRLSSTP